MEADDRGGYLHSVVGSKSTPARGTRRMKQEKSTPTPVGSNLPLFRWPLFSFNLPLFPPYFSTSWPLPFYIPASFLPLPITFQCFCRFHLTALPHLCLHQPNFLSFSLTVAFSLFPFPFSPILSSHLLLAKSLETRKRRSALSQHRFSFHCHCDGAAWILDWWFGAFPLG